MVLECYATKSIKPIREEWKNPDVKEYNQFGIKYDVVEEDLTTKKKEVVFSHYLKRRAKNFRKRMSEADFDKYFTVWEVHKDGECEQIY